MGYPVTLNGRTYTLADFTGQNYVSGFPDALEDYVTDAATQVAAAASSATDAATSATAAAGSATAALNSAVSAQASLDAIEGLYLGAQSSNPTVDLNGDALTAGDWYFNTTSNSAVVYDGSAWNTITSYELSTDTTPQLGGTLDFNGNIATSFESTGIDDNATSTQIEIDANNNITFGYGGATISGGKAIWSLKDANGGNTHVGWVSSGSADNTASAYYTYGNAGVVRWRTYDASTTTYTNRLSLDSNGRMGLGVTSPTRGFEAAAYSGQQIIAHFQTTSATRGLITVSDANTTSDSYVGVGANGDDLELRAGEATRVTVDSTGDVSITANGGGASNSGDITVNLRAKFGYDGSRQAALISDSATNKAIVFDTNGSERVRITTTGTVCVGDEAPASNGPSSRLYVCSEDNNTGVSDNTNIPDIFVGGSSTAGGSGAGGEIRFGSRVYGTSGFAAFKGYITDGTASGNLGNLDLNMRAANTSASYTRRFRWYYTGDFHADGNVVAYSTSISDVRLKENIETVTGALDKIEAIRGVTFDRIDTGKRSAGVIAQELEPHLPEAIIESPLPLKTGDDDELYKLVEYDAIHALTIEGIKELVAEVRSLRAEVEALKNGR